MEGGRAPESDNEGAVAPAPEGHAVVSAGAGSSRVGVSVERSDEVPSAGVGNATWAADSAGCGEGCL